MNSQTHIQDLKRSLTKKQLEKVLEKEEYLELEENLYSLAFYGFFIDSRLEHDKNLSSCKNHRQIEELIMDSMID
tara:strand:+ start:302 stop:526 length:225 start_codon:yes stop_codon:yes gene_type:complete